MLRPLFYLCALIALPGAAAQTITSNSRLNVSSCPITFFGQKYEEIYVSFTDTNTAVCFNGFFNAAGTGDCILGPRVNFAFLTISQRFAWLEERIHENIPAITSTMVCFLEVYLNTPTYSLLSIANFQQQAALELFYTGIGTQRATVRQNGMTVAELAVTNTAADPQTSRYTDISGCRSNGVTYLPNTEVSSDPATCTTLRCSRTALLETTTCGPTETCLGNGVCFSPTTTPPTTSPLHSICTVTGPTVIDFSSHLASVKDRCDYYLLQIQGLSVVGSFLERRLKDVNFLDSVTLEVNDVRIVLKQGGIVLVDGTPLNLDSSPQTVNGVQLSKDQTGVTVIVQIGNLKIIIFFDGYTVLIFVEGSTGSSLQGLCQDSSSDAKLPDCSSISCQTQYNDTDDRYIHCINKTESCNLLKEAPFTSCPIDPEPYITACTDTLSIYPAVDGLKCQFLQAYVKACSLFSNITLDGWGSKAECSSKAFCQDRTCSFHEFCGEGSHYGDTRCFCRADFASCYRHCFGEPTVCRQNNAYLTLAICLLEDKGIDYSVLHLNDPTCTGQVDQQNHMVTFSFNSSNCGTEIMTNGSQIIYRNTIMTQNFTSDMIIRHDDVMIDFSCYHVQPDIKTVSFTVVDSDVSKALTAGPWTYTVSMKAYVDNECTKPVERYHNLRLNQRVWVKLDTDGLDGNVIAVVIDACWATNQPSATATKKYYLIENGCPNPADPTVMIKGNGEGTTSYFSFNMFRFSGGSNEIHLHCSLHLCLKEEGNCVKTCGLGRRRRSASSTYKSDSFISMGWTH